MEEANALAANAEEQKNVKGRRAPPRKKSNSTKDVQVGKKLVLRKVKKAKRGK